MRIHRRTDLTLNDLAAWLNPIVAGWMRYYGRYFRSALDPLLRRVSFYLKRWAREQIQTTADPQTVPAVVARTPEREPSLFAHWEWTTRTMGW